MTTAMSLALFLLIFLIPGMSFGMALIGLIRSQFWTTIAALAIAAVGLAFLPAQIAAILVGYMFLGIWCAWDDPDLLYHAFSY